MEDTSNDELIEQYLLGNLSGDPLRAFNERLAADNRFKKEVDLQRAIIRNIKSMGREEWKLKLETLHKEMNTGVEEKQTARIIPLKRFYEKKYMLGAAAMVIAVVISAWWMFENSSAGNERIFLAYYKPYANIEQSTRSLPQAALTERNEAFMAYDKGDYARSIRLFKQVLEKKEDEVALFYLGNAYLSDNRFQEAETIFKAYLNRYREFAPESGWYLSLSYIRQGKMKEARPLLEELVKRKSGFSKEAGEILSKLYK